MRVLTVQEVPVPCICCCAADKDAAEPLDYLLVYASPDVSMPTQYTVDAKTVYIDYSA